MLQRPAYMVCCWLSCPQCGLGLEDAHLPLAGNCLVPVKARVVDSSGASSFSLGPWPEGQEPFACSVSWISHDLLEDENGLGSAIETATGGTLDSVDSALLEDDFVLTDALQKVPFAGSRGRVSFFERILPIPPADNEVLDFRLASKELLVSVLLPSKKSVAWASMHTRAIAEHVVAAFPDHTFIDDGLLTTYERAFLPYRFSLIVDDENATVSQAFVHCIASGTIPLFNGFTHLVAMLPRVVVPWDRANFHASNLLSVLQSINQDIAALWQQHRFIQDQLLYRYAHGFNESFHAIACNLCAHKQSAAEDHQSEDAAHRLPPLAFVGVYSAQDNFRKRAAIRQTWGRAVRAHGFDVKFFLGRPRARVLRLQAEISRHADVVLLDVQDGYKRNSVKGLMFLEWCALNVLARFIIKADDDVYLRPYPLLSLLENRPPFGYVWGYFDYFSPVPKDDADDAFFNPDDIYPFAVFPPYARGLLRVLSVDVVVALADMSFSGKLPLIFGDDPCLGVHLRFLRHDRLGLPMLTLDDRDSYRIFAMEPSCNAELWSHVTPRSWVIHHVSAEQVECMWDADVNAGMYKLLGGTRNVTLSPEAVHMARAAASVSTQERESFEEPPPFPDLCECLAVGPMAAKLAERRDKINATRTYQMWGHPSFLDQVETSQ